MLPRSSRLHAPSTRPNCLERGLHAIRKSNRLVNDDCLTSTYYYWFVCYHLLSADYWSPIIFVALHAMWRGLKAIHRDLSSGNVFYDNKNRSGRLGDLEFVTFYTDDAVYKENSHSLSIKTVKPSLFLPYLQWTNRSAPSNSWPARSSPALI